MFTSGYANGYPSGHWNRYTLTRGEMDRDYPWEIPMDFSDNFDNGTMENLPSTSVFVPTGIV